MYSNIQKRLVSLENAGSVRDGALVIVRHLFNDEGKRVKSTRLVSKPDGRRWDLVQGESYDEFEARVVCEIEQTVGSGVVSLYPAKQ
jgi:hypothetical protein